eukprot:1154100-Pelagomonas_calceolata.AAC.1
MQSEAQITLRHTEQFQKSTKANFHLVETQLSGDKSALNLPEPYRKPPHLHEEAEAGEHSQTA